VKRLTTNIKRLVDDAWTSRVEGVYGVIVESEADENAVWPVVRDYAARCRGVTVMDICKSAYFMNGARVKVLRSKSPYEIEQSKLVRVIHVPAGWPDSLRSKQVTLGPRFGL